MKPKEQAEIGWSATADRNVLNPKLGQCFAVYRPCISFIDSVL